MTHLVFLPIKDKIKEGTYLIYDNASRSGEILSESKQFITDPDGRIASNAVIHNSSSLFSGDAGSGTQANFIAQCKKASAKNGWRCRRSK